MVPVTGDDARDWGAVVPLFPASTRDTWVMAELPLPETRAETVEAWVVSMRDRKRRLMSERTIGSRRGTMLRLVADLDPVTATAEQVEAWLEGLDVVPNSRATYWAQARVFFAWMHGTGRRDDDPTATVETFPAVKGSPRPLSEPEMQAVLRVCQDPRRWQTRAYVLLGAFAGLRVHEIAKIRGEDIKDGQLEVVGKGRHVGLVPLHPMLAELAEAMPSPGWWFPSSTRSGHVNRVSVGAAIKRAFVAAGVDATPHALRHYYGSAVLEMSGDIYVTQKALRHLAISSTLVYAKLPDEKLRAAISRIGPRPAA